MTILALESSAGPASVAVLRDGKILYESNLNTATTHSGTLMPMVSEAMRITNMQIKDVDFLAVACGPGSFTGVRIGVSAVKGMAFGGDKKCVGVSTLEAMAYNLLPVNGTAVCVMDARCAQVYCGIFKITDGAVSRIAPDNAVSVRELKETLKTLGGDIYLVGDGVELCYLSFKDDVKNVRLSPANARYQRASSVALCAEKKLENGEEAVSGSELEVKYLRLPQAERELLAKKEKDDNKSPNAV